MPPYRRAKYSLYNNYLNSIRYTHMDELDYSCRKVDAVEGPGSRRASSGERWGASEAGARDSAPPICRQPPFRCGRSVTAASRLHTQPQSGDN